MMTDEWDGATTLMWGGEDRRFRLGIGELRRVEAVAKVGIFSVLDRLITRTATLDEIRAVLKYGLEGAGVDPNTAEADVRRYFDDAPKAPSLPIAAFVLMTALHPPEDATSEKPAGDGTQPNGSPSP